MPDTTPEKPLSENQIAALKRLSEIDGTDYSSQLRLDDLLGLVLPPIGGFAIDAMNFIESGQRDREYSYLLDVVHGKCDMHPDQILRIAYPEVYG